MRGRWKQLLLGLVVVGTAAAALQSWRQVGRESSARSTPRRTADAASRMNGDADALIAESEPLIPPMLEGVALGQTLGVLRSRRTVTPSLLERDPSLRWLEERLANGAQVLYGFERAGELLVQIQVLSRMDVEGLRPHLTAMTEQYGSPTGIWDCSAESAAGVPTRRFTWRHHHVTVQDVILVYPAAVSVTLYIGLTETIARSLQLNRCSPVTSREQLEAFPIATPEQVRPPR